MNYSLLVECVERNFSVFNQLVFFNVAVQQLQLHQNSQNLLKSVLVHS